MTDAQVAALTSSLRASGVGYNVSLAGPGDWHVTAMQPGGADIDSIKALMTQFGVNAKTDRAMFL
jgi:hypothetical protein